MKYILIALSFAFFAASKAQNYADSTITLTLTQRSAVYVGYYVQQNTFFVWANRLAPTNLKPYVGTGMHLDSLFSVTLKADFITGMINLLFGGQDEMVQADRLSIINNSPSISGYTALATQVVNKANGSSSEKNVATYIMNYYNNQVAALAAQRAAIIASVVQWSQN